MKLVRVHTLGANAPTVRAIADTQQVRLLSGEEDTDAERELIELLVSDEKLQGVLDALQSLLRTETGDTVVVMATETTLPKASDAERREEDRAVAVREALFDQAERSARLDTNYLVLVTLSTVVAAIGLLENNVAVVIGAMVIAPLLGPNLALGLGSALGDTVLMRQALGTAVFSGMLGVTMLGLFLTPVFYVVLQRIFGKRRSHDS